MQIAPSAPTLQGLLEQFYVECGVDEDVFGPLIAADLARFTEARILNVSHYSTFTEQELKDAKIPPSIITFFNTHDVRPRDPAVAGAPGSVSLA